MKLIVTGRRLTVSESDRAEIAAKVGHLDRILNSSAVSAQCVIGREKLAIVCELTVHVRGGHMLHGLGRHARLATAVSLAVTKVEQQAKRLTGRWKGKRRDGAGPVEAATSEPPRAAEEPRAPKVIRAKGYEAKPMTVADAAMLLASSANTVLVFRHAVSGAVNVLYRRPDGHLGLIEPEA